MKPVSEDLDFIFDHIEKLLNHKVLSDSVVDELSDAIHRVGHLAQIGEKVLQQD